MSKVMPRETLDPRSGEPLYEFDAAPVPSPATREPALIFTLREAETLVEMFGGEDAEMTVRNLPAGVIKGDDGVDLPAGLYAHCTDYPEEGSAYLGPCEVNDEPATPFEPPPPATPVEGAGDAELKALIYRMDPSAIEDAFKRLSQQNAELAATVSQQAAEIAELERSETQLIDERDAAEEALSQAYYLVVGDSPEWSNLFGHAEALEGIGDAISLAKQVASRAETAESKVVEQAAEIAEYRALRMGLAATQDKTSAVHRELLASNANMQQASHDYSALAMSLESALAACRGDAERLDWINKQSLGDPSFCLVVDRPHDGEYEVSFWANYHKTQMQAYGPTLRAAIDRAILASAPKSAPKEPT